MELIIKPTSKCNFKCSFCSAANLQLLHQVNVPDDLKNVLNILQPDMCIITGGEPLLVQPSYYEELLALGKWKISMTSNLKDFYINPEKWKKLFKNSRISISTSFQYGDGRKWDNNTVYSEKMFIDVMSKFKELIGYIPSFIAVVDDKSEQLAFKHLELAKRLNTTCKINGVMPLGKSISFYPQHKLIKLWLDAIDLGYEKQLNMNICLKNGGCNLNTALLCKSCIRSLTFDRAGKLLYSYCEDELTNGVYYDVDAERPVPTKENISISEHITSECIFCELFYVCHGCRQYRCLNKTVENHCIEMKKLKDRIMKANWKIQP